MLTNLLKQAQEIRSVGVPSRAAPTSEQTSACKQPDQSRPYGEERCATRSTRHHWSPADTSAGARLHEHRLCGQRSIRCIQQLGNNPTSHTLSLAVAHKKHTQRLSFHGVCTNRRATWPEAQTVKLVAMLLVNKHLIRNGNFRLACWDEMFVPILLKLPNDQINNCKYTIKPCNNQLLY